MTLEEILNLDPPFVPYLPQARAGHFLRWRGQLHLNRKEMSLNAFCSSRERVLRLAQESLRDRLEVHLPSLVLRHAGGWGSDQQGTSPSGGRVQASIPASTSGRTVK